MQGYLVASRVSSVKERSIDHPNKFMPIFVVIACHVYLLCKLYEANNTINQLVTLSNLPQDCDKEKRELNIAK